ncbi:small ubiquitin-related modifier 2-like [Lycium ferocissimum]|uniref:small ubiquitin-related modifier 2-like n=1 Tax=Lycium ferocissimum TaxID=112874 RepID=UPI002816512E|nr:small ubiquitin-related modifier 2-like [Lycium ferocissimum]
MATEKKTERPFEESTGSNSENCVYLRIKSQDGTSVYLTVDPSSVMKVIFKEYCKRKQIIYYKTVRFFFNGQRISPRKTVNEHGLENNDEIDAMLHQEGGGPAHRI